jgi:DNA-binding transcriptional regulator GbsR (MarR family)
MAGVTKKHMTEEELKLETEHLGVSFDKIGFPPLAGRVVAYLMLSDPPYRTFDEIVEHLQASKSSISTTLKYLEQMELTTYKTFPGDRRRHFRVAPKRWVSLIRVNDKLRTLINLFDHVLALRNPQEDVLNPEIEEIKDLYLYLEKELPMLLQRWEKSRNKKG